MTKEGKQKQDWSAHSLSTALAPAVPSALEQAGLQHKQDQDDNHDDWDDNHDMDKFDDLGRTIYQQAILISLLLRFYLRQEGKCRTKDPSCFGPSENPGSLAKKADGHPPLAPSAPPAGRSARNHANCRKLCFTGRLKFGFYFT